MFVLVCTIKQRIGDGRFYPSARQAAARLDQQIERTGNHRWDYALDIHSCIVNSAMEYLVRPERGKGRYRRKSNSWSGNSFA